MARLTEFTDRFPGRLSGSTTLTAATAWAADKMKADGLQNVHLEKVMVPHWVRGHESADLVMPYGDQPIYIAGLGNSTGTGPDGITADAVVVHNYTELDSLGDKVKGKIVVYNYQYIENGDPLVNYRLGTQYRGAGASRAAKYGAAAVLIRSVGPIAHRTPHTGSMRYAADLPQIPAASLSGEDADKLQRIQDRGESIHIRLKMEAKFLPDVEAANVIGELSGTEKPDEVVVVGGHIDSWDITPGTLDDGGGIMATWEAVRILKRLNLRPRRTIRVILFVNEENGGRGGRTYAEDHKEQFAKHQLALESDNGVLPLHGFNFDGTPHDKEVIQQIVNLLGPIHATEVGEHFDGADITPLSNMGLPVVSPEVDMHRYFFVHHTNADTVDKISTTDLDHCIAAIAVMAYVAADIPETLEKSLPKPATAPGGR
jgi:carboxypeptidase Q